jgi:hypothetical protein
LACAGSWEDIGVRRGRGAAGHLPSSRRRGLRCAVGQARFTRAFEDQTAWLAVNTSKSAVAELMGIAWRTVGGICERVCDETSGEENPEAEASTGAHPAEDADPGCHEVDRGGRRGPVSPPVGSCFSIPSRSLAGSLRRGAFLSHYVVMAGLAHARHTRLLSRGSSAVAVRDNASL